MNTYNLALHIFHITCGAFWAGTALMLHFYLLPAINSLGPEGGKAMAAITGTRKFPLVLTLNAVITIVSGILLMNIQSGGFAYEWFGSHTGMVLSLGGSLAIIALFIGIFVNKPAATRLNEIAAAISSAGGPPNDQQAVEMNQLRRRIAGGIRVIAWLVLITVICMASAHHI